MTSTAVEGVVTSESPPTTFDKLSAATLFLWMSANQGANPPLLNSSVGGNASRCSNIYSFMQSMCNDNELKVLAEMASLPSQAEASLSKAFGPVTKRSKAR